MSVATGNALISDTLQHNGMTHLSEVIAVYKHPKFFRPVSAWWSISRNRNRVEGNMQLNTSTSEHSSYETKSCAYTSKRQTSQDLTIVERIAIFRNKGSLQFPINLRPAYMAGFNNSISDATIAPIPSAFAGGNDKTRVYCCGANDASLCLPICSNNRLFNKILKNMQY